MYLDLVFNLFAYDNILFSDRSYDDFMDYITDNPIVWLKKHEEPEI